MRGIYDFLTTGLRRAARVLLIRLRIPHTSFARVILANAVREIIIVRAELARAITTHPTAARSRPHRKRDADIGTTTLKERAVVMEVQRIDAGFGASAHVA